MQTLTSLSRSVHDNMNTKEVPNRIIVILPLFLESSTVGYSIEGENKPFYDMPVKDTS